MSDVQNAPSTITFDDFLKVDIRVGNVVAADRVRKSRNLLKLQVDFGVLGQRQIVAGINEFYDPESVVGLSLIFVVNLAPRKIIGLESHGMLLAGLDMADGELSLPTCSASPGTQLR